MVLRVWLFFVSLFLVVLVLVGGATRLTDSGLSITDWSPFFGILPPLTPDDWTTAFLAYQGTTEYQTINRDMNLESFKFIFWWEWLHRFLARLVGLIFILPFFWFWLRGYLSNRLTIILGIILLLGFLQAFVGWWMVKSGLVGRVDVSHIRLSVHLTLACIIYALTLWLFFSLSTNEGRGGGFIYNVFFVLVVLLQISLGGLVAGLDAGLAFTTWPLMDGALVPPVIFSTTNFIDNAAFVQFAHRLVAYILVILVTGRLLWLYYSRLPTTETLILFLLVMFQAALGVLTLLGAGDIYLSLLHQFFGILVLSSSIFCCRVSSGRFLVT